MKKIIFILIMLITLTSCTLPNHNTKQIVSINIITLPSKLSFFENEELDFTSLEVEVVYNNNETKIISDYKISYDKLVRGINKIYISYENISTYFEIEIKQKEKIKIKDHLDYYLKTTKNINYQEYDLTYKNVSYGTSRTTNAFIAYDEEYFVKTNIYGYEVAVDKYGQVVETAKNVILPQGGFVLSAHGTSVSKLKEIELGDTVLYFNETVYVYKNDMLKKYNQVYLMFYEYLSYLDTINDIDLYNQLVTKLNDLIESLDYIYLEYDENIKNVLIETLSVETNDFLDEHIHQYSYIKYQQQDLELEDVSNFNYELAVTYTDKLYIGGFRQADTLVYYDALNYRTRNTTGFEVAVDKNGIVVQKDILVELPDGGFILSGHTSTKTFLIENVNMYDKIEIIDGAIYIYKDYLKMLYNYYVELRNDLNDEITYEFKKEIPHDYQYLNELIEQIDILINCFKEEDLTIFTMNQSFKITNQINSYIATSYAQLIEYDPSLSRGIWYYPFSKPGIYDDTTLEGVIETITNFKEMGINEIIISLFAEDECLFDSSMYKKYHKLENYDYGKYGNDYLKCFIEECHKQNILVNAFTQTFHGYVTSMKEPNEEYYQKNYQDELSKGNIYYYDICNDNLQNELLNWYSELISLYDFDKIEYDIIRYPSSNLHLYLETDKVLADKEITDHGYTTYTMNKFMERYNLEGDLRTLIKENKEIRALWLNFKEEALINFITNCTKMMKEIKPNIIITAAVFNNYDNAKKSYLQDYRKWLDLKIVDQLDVMLYTSSNIEFNKVIATFNDLYKNYNIRIGVSPRLDDRNIVTDIYQLYKSSKNDGYIIYSSSLYYDDRFTNILKSNHHLPYLNDLSEKNKLLQLNIQDIIDMIKYYYSVKNNTFYDNLISELENDGNYLELINNLDDESMKQNLLDKVS